MNLQSFVFIGNASIEATLPLFNLDFQAFLMMIPNLISFIILAFIFTQFLYKPVKDHIKKRADYITDEINEAAKIMAIVDELKHFHEQQVKENVAERNIIFEKARKEVSTRSNQILDEAKEEAIALKNDARNNIAIELENANEGIQQAIIDVSIHMVEKVVNKRICRVEHEELLEKLFAEAMEELENPVFRTYSKR